MKEHELVSTILGRLSTLLSQVPSVCSVDPQPEALGGEAGRADGILAVSLEGSTVHTLVVEAKGNAQPRNVRDAARRLTTLVEELRSGGVPHPSAILGAPYVSERSAAVLAEHGVGHLDLAGNARLAFGPVYVERSGHANPHAVDRPFSSLFAPKTSRVARALLAHPSRVWRLQELADEVDVSLALVAKAKASLLNGEYARDSPDGLVLADPEGLLDAWLVADRRRPKPRGYYSLDPIPETERRIAAVADEIGVRAALTAFSGAERVAPHVRYTHASILIEADAFTEVGERAGLRPVETGANVRLHEPYDYGAFYGAQDIDGVPVAHPVQLILDLAREKGRGEEAADFLRRHALAPTWADLRR